ncbi:MAG: hypothetical protein ACFFB2_09180 [Promethearchaeota archaeon]
MPTKYTTRRSLQDRASAFNNFIPSELRSIMKIFWENGKNVYIVGGAVRDFLLGFPVKDFDIATNAHPKEMEKFLNEKGVKTKPIGSKYGTILAIIGKNAVFDICTFRQEIHTELGPPEVIFVNSLEEDLPRRDFRFNAIAFDPKNHQFIDIFNGYADIQKCTVQMIGNAFTRLSEDGTRIIRLARFISQFPKLRIHPDLLAATNVIGKTAKFHNYTTLKKEFFKLLMLSDPRKGLCLLWETQTLDALFPHFPLLSFDCDKSEIIFTKFKEILSHDKWIRFFGLLLLLSKEPIQTKRLLIQLGQDWKITTKEQNRLDHLLHSLISFPQTAETKKIKRWIRSTGINTSEDLLQLLFLYPELLGDSNLLLNKRSYFKKAQTILESFRQTSKKNLK